MQILGIKEYGIKKYQTGTQKGGIQPQSEEERYNQYLEQMKKQYPGTYIDQTPIWTSINPSKEMKSYGEFLEELKASNPEEYNRLMESSTQSETSEISKPWIDAKGNVRKSTNVGAGFVSGTDPVMQMYVEGVALNPVFKAIGTAGLYGLGRMGNNWAKAKLINRAMSTIDDSRLGFNIPHESVDVQFIKKPWRSNPSNSNTTMRIYPKGRRDQGYFELVKDIEPNAYSVHFKTSKTPGDIIPTTYEERIPLWNALREAIPEGSYVSTWGYLSDDGVKAVNKVGRGWEKVGLRNVHLKSGEPITIPIWYKPYNQKFNISSKSYQASIGNPVQIKNGTEYYMPDQLLEEVKRGKEAAAKFFEHPVVQQSYKHNQELAEKLGITIPNRPENIGSIIRQPVKIRWSGAPSNSYAAVSQTYLGDPDAVISYKWMPFDRKTFGITTIHENLHRGFYSAPLKYPNISKEYYDNIYKPQYSFYNWKTKKLLKPEYYDSYLTDISGGEAGPNFIDLGRDLGLKLGQKYPGYEAANDILQNYTGFKSWMIPQLNTSKAGMRHIWDAMTGKYFTIPAGGVLINQTIQNNSGKAKQYQDGGSVQKV